MEGPAVASERDLLAWCLQQPSVSHHKFATLRPDFLIISPPKTASTWLAANLRRHPELYINDIKEVKYFSSYYKWLDFNWYLDHFIEGMGRIKGEATPSYALLPVARIRLIRRLFPDVKLLFLMRDPISRAWSHARHNQQYREANFAGTDTAIDAVGNREWCENFTHDWPLASGDYLGQLRRWLSVFPREQIFVAFFESIAHRPEALLRDVFSFLGVEAGVDLSGFPVREKILAGRPWNLAPALRQHLHLLLHARTRELAVYLRDQFDLQPPDDWRTILESSATNPDEPPAAFLHEFDDNYLSRVLQHEETLPGPSRMVFESYKGYNLFVHGGRLFALAQGLGPIAVETLSSADIQRHQQENNCFVVTSLAEMKDRVDQHIYHRTQGRLGNVIGVQDVLCADVECLKGTVMRLENNLAELRSEAIRLSPWAFSLLYILRKVWRGLRKALTGKAIQPTPPPTAPAVP